MTWLPVSAEDRGGQQRGRLSIAPDQDIPLAKAPAMT
jgi:hypothetical protein